MRISYGRYGWVELTKQNAPGWWGISSIRDGNHVPVEGDEVAIGSFVGAGPRRLEDSAALPPGLKLGEPNYSTGFWPVEVD